MKHIKNRSRVKEQQRRKDYAGTEASPYGEWLDSKGDYNQEHQAVEPSEANPDVIQESEGLYYIQPIISEEQIEMIRKALPFLTDKQKQVLQLLGYEGKTLESVGAILGISKQAVLSILNRAREIVKKKGTV